MLLEGHALLCRRVAMTLGFSSREMQILRKTQAFDRLVLANSLIKVCFLLCVLSPVVRHN
jgi:hypothetical protein